MKTIDKLLLNGEKFSDSEKYHKKTQNRALKSIKYSDYPGSWIKIHFKTYPRLDKVKLLNPNNLGKNSRMFYLISKRRSKRDFNGKSINLNELSYLLGGSAGITRFENNHDYNSSRRRYPSAGARYPLEIYPLVLNCKTIKSGLYHYNVKDSSLELLKEENLSTWLLKYGGGDKWLSKASVIFIITTVLNRTKIKYGDRGYRYSLIEAGHIVQNLSLLATEINLGSCAVGGFIDAEFDKLLDINLLKEFTLYLVAVGKCDETK